jgi:hypothetical protein
MWGVSEHLLASLIEVVDAVSWRPVLPHVKRGWKQPKAVQVPRPHQQERSRRRRATSEDLKRIFGGGAYRPREVS